MSHDKRAGGLAALEAGDKGRPYEFKSPELLLEDFFNEVERVLRELGVDTAPVDMRKR